MNKNVIIAGLGACVLILILVMAMGGGSKPDSSQPNDSLTPQPTEGVMGPPIPEKIDFKIYFEKYLQGNCPDPTRITATLKQNPDWVQDVLPESFYLKYKEMKARTYTILFPFLTPEDIKRTKLLQAVVSAERKPLDVIALIKLGANVNEPGVITSVATPEVLEYLLEHGADPNVPDEQGAYAYDIFSSAVSKDKRLILEKHGGHGKAP